MSSVGKNIKVDLSKEDLLNFYLNKILLDWIESNRPDIVDRAKQFVNEELSNNEICGITE